MMVDCVLCYEQDVHPIKRAEFIYHGISVCRTHYDKLKDSFIKEVEDNL